jgi:hypothetical protein
MYVLYQLRYLFITCIMAAWEAILPPLRTTALEDQILPNITSLIQRNLNQFPLIYTNSVKRSYLSSIYS